MPFRFVNENSKTENENQSSRFRFIESEPSTTQKIASSAPAQAALGGLKRATFPADLFKLAMIGEGLSDLDELEDTYRRAGKEFDRDEYIRKVYQAAEVIPTQELGEELVKKYTGLDLKPKDTAGKIGRFGGEIFSLKPGSLLEGGTKEVAKKGAESATRATVAEGLKELGVPGILADTTSLSLPSLEKKIIPTKSQKDLVMGARELGLTEEEIAPLIQSERKQKFLAKAAPRRGRTKKILDKSYKALSNIYDRLENSEIATKELSPENSSKILNSIRDQMKKLPTEARKLVEKDFEELTAAPLTGASMTNFFKDINYNIGNGHKQLGILKEPLIKGFEAVSPEFASDFKITNALYSKYADINKKLKPTLVSDLFTAGQAIRLVTGLSLGNVPFLTEVVGEHSARLLARELLLNPRLQNISNKMMSALNNNKYAAANKFLKSYVDEMEETNPEIAKQLKTIDFSTQLRKDNK